MNHLTPPPPQQQHGGMPPPGGLTRYASAPGAFLAALADSVTCGGGVQLAPPLQQQQQQQAGQHVGRGYFSGESSGLTSSGSSCRTGGGQLPAQLQRAYGGSGEIHVPPPTYAAATTHDAPAVSTLFRHSSSPAGLLSRLMADHHGMAATRGGMGSYSHSQAGADGAMAQRRLSSQWSFSRQDLPQISEMGGIIPDIGESITGGGCNSSSDGGAGAQSSSYLSRNFSMSSWDDTNNSIIFSGKNGATKAGDAAGDDIVTSFSNVDSQFGLSRQSSLEMAGMDDFMQLQQQDSVACRVRAKRGFATHPRSIAERERRTRISKRLKKLEDLVPNMDKQTNTSEMLDIAVHYIKELQGQIEKLKQDQANCTCSGNQNC